MRPHGTDGVQNPAQEKPELPFTMKTQTWWILSYNSYFFAVVLMI